MFTGDLERKTYADVEAFLAEKIPEGLRLDYKRTVTDKIERTIAAMANSEGGVIVIGVDEERATRKPQLPPVGIDLAGQAERVQSKAYQAIYEPITALDIRDFPSSDDAERGVLVVRVQPSEHAPHAVDQGHTILRRVGAQAMKEGNDLDDRMDLDRIGWLFERRQRNRQLIDASLTRYESLLLSEPPPDGHYRFDIVAYPAVAHAEPLTVRDLRSFTNLRGRHQFWLSPPRTVSGGLMSNLDSPNFPTSSYCDVTGITAYTATWPIEENPGEPRRTFGGWWFEPSLRLLEWVGLVGKESGRGGTVRVRARLQGVRGTQLLLDQLNMIEKHLGHPPSLDNEVLATASTSIDDLASDPKPCVAELISQLAEAFGREISPDDMLKMIGG